MAFDRFKDDRGFNNNLNGAVVSVDPGSYAIAAKLVDSEWDKLRQIVREEIAASLRAETPTR